MPHAVINSSAEFTLLGPFAVVPRGEKCGSVFCLFAGVLLTAGIMSKMIQAPRIFCMCNQQCSDEIKLSQKRQKSLGALAEVLLHVLPFPRRAACSHPSG